jgi:glucokinase
MLVLSGDIGGTNSRLQLTRYDKSLVEVIKRDSFKNHDFKNFKAIVDHFLEACSVSTKTVTSICLAVAGPIVNQSVRFTNLPWFIDAHLLKKELGIKCVELINDFQAIGHGISQLTQQDMISLQKGEYQATAPRAIIGPGTGLGVGITLWNGQYHEVVPTEGGHVDFSPTSHTQMELLQYLRRKYHRVSVERIVSGPGIENIYHFVCDNPIYAAQETEALRFAITSEPHNIAPTISRFALEHQDPVALRVLDIFIKAYGTIAGNLALTTLPFGGLYLVGNMTNRLLEPIKTGQFLNKFLDKGRISGVLERIPIHVVLEQNVGLIGAAHYAAKTRLA